MKKTEIFFSFLFIAGTLVAMAGAAYLAFHTDHALGFIALGLEIAFAGYVFFVAAKNMKK